MSAERSCMPTVARACAVLLFAAALSVAAQAPRPADADRAAPSGTWKSEPPTFLTLVIKSDASTVTGVLNTCSSQPFIPSEILEGHVEGSTITFKCISDDGDRTVTFRGTINGDQIDFVWDMAIRDGGRPPELFDPFAPLPGRRTQGPPRFTAKRAPDSEGALILARLAERIRSRPSTPVTFERIANAEREPENWLTYSGNLLGWRHSLLAQITPANVQNLDLAWVWQQARSAGRFEATPLVADGVLYTVQAPNDVVALDAATGRFLWMFRYQPAPPARASGGGGRVNRGVALLGDRLFLGTLDAHLLAIHAKTGQLLWNAKVADVADPACQVPNGWNYCYSITHAPLVVKDTVMVGTGGGDGESPGHGIRGFIAAFDATTGNEVWRFATIPAPGEPGSDTWAGDSWKTGGAGVWMTGAYDPELNLTYWGTGNPLPSANGAARLGANLYSDSVVALDADRGTLKWHFQFSPHDEKDRDESRVPVLTDIEWSGRRRKVMLWAGKAGLMHVLDRVTGELLMVKRFIETAEPQVPATNWYPASYSPRTGLFYIPAWERKGSGAGNGYGAVRALDPKTGERKWQFVRSDAVFFSGVMTTASGLLFGGTWGDSASGSEAARVADGRFYGLDARNGQLLWHRSLGGSVFGGPMSYSVAGTQYIVVAAGNTLFAFALR